MTKMDQSIKARWVAALRSGEYKQTTGALREAENPMENNSTVCFCCLGVLCDIYAKERIPAREWRLSELEAEDASLPGQTVSEWASFPWHENDPQVTIGGFRKRISEHNDAGCTFAEIADAIEAQL